MAKYVPHVGPSDKPSMESSRRIRRFRRIVPTTMAARHGSWLSRRRPAAINDLAEKTHGKHQKNTAPPWWCFIFCHPIKGGISSRPGFLVVRCAVAIRRGA
jgi:hypothetical protein